MNGVERSLPSPHSPYPQKRFQSPERHIQCKILRVAFLYALKTPHEKSLSFDQTGRPLAFLLRLWSLVSSSSFVM